MALKRDRGRFFEDAEVGDEYASPARTVTEADIAAFAALTGDHSPMHTDEEFCRRRGLEGRIAHGLLGLGMVEGLLFRVPPPEGRGLASLGWRWRFLRPIRPGDTVCIRWRIASKRLSRSRPGQGVVEEAIRLMNQREEIVQEGTHAILLACRPAGVEAGVADGEAGSPTRGRSEDSGEAVLVSFQEARDEWTAAWQAFLKPAEGSHAAGEFWEEGEAAFEDLQVGQRFASPRRTVAEADVLAFAGITGDYAMVHTDEEYCRDTEFGTRIAHGLLGLSLAEGLRRRLGGAGGVGSGAAPLEWAWSFRQPIVPGDTIRVDWTIRETRPSRRNPAFGIVLQDVRLRNQRDTIVQEGHYAQLMRRRLPAG